MSADRTVVLFRSGQQLDPYEAALRKVGFTSVFIPVLRFEFVNQRELRRALEHPRHYDGIVFPSPRSVEALTSAMSWLPTETVLWHTKAIFAVGPSTSSALREIGFTPIGEEAGTAARLAELIVDHDFDKPLLYLCGNRRRDELPSRLRAYDVAFEEVCVYESHIRTDLDLASRPLPDWIVFFSPSGVEAVRSDAGCDLTSVRVATIGSTTAEAARASGMNVDAVADKPTPDSLSRAITGSDARLSGRG